MRMGAGIFVSALFLWLLVSLLITGGSEANAGPQTWTSSRQCMSCHEEVFAEWQDSWHARSWTDPDVRAPSQSNNFQNKDCIDCHAPRPLQSRTHLSSDPPTPSTRFTAWPGTSETPPILPTLPLPQTLEHAVSFRRESRVTPRRRIPSGCGLSLMIDKGAIDG